MNDPDRRDATPLRFATPRLLSDCVHCGLCLEACPTYLELGQEPDSPRGRIYLMKALAEGRLEPEPGVVRHLDLCLGCRGCETACPSGVHYGALLESARGWLETTVPRGPGQDFLRRFLVGRVMRDPGLFRASIRLLRLAVRTGLAPLAGPLFPPGFDAGRWGRALAPQPRTILPERTPGVPPVRGRVILLTGCVMDGLFGRVNEATVRLLSRQGWEVLVPRGQGCCGALAAHAGLADLARTLAGRNAALFDRLDADHVVTNAAGCGAMMKEAGSPLASRARDISEILALGPLRGPLRAPQFGAAAGAPPSAAGPAGAPSTLRVAYHDACHLAHGQKITLQPRDLLAQVPGIRVVPLRESDVCCGSAGSYNILEAGMAARLGARKAGHLRASGAEVVVAGNMGCLVQMAGSLATPGPEGRSHPAGPVPRLVHLVELLEAAGA